MQEPYLKVKPDSNGYVFHVFDAMDTMIGVSRHFRNDAWMKIGLALFSDYGRYAPTIQKDDRKPVLGARFEYGQTDDGCYRFQLITEAGRSLFVSESFVSIDLLDRAIHQCRLTAERCNSSARNSYRAQDQEMTQQRSESVSISARKQGVGVPKTRQAESDVAVGEKTNRSILGITGIDFGIKSDLPMNQQNRWMRRN